MLNESKLLSFIDAKQEYSLHILEGQKLIHDLAIIHELKGSGFAFFRDTVLSSLCLVPLLKNDQSLGFYIDSEEPKFMLKVEVSEEGNFRTLLLPEVFNKFPEQITGKARLAKIEYGQSKPYTSVIELKKENLANIVNIILKTSYQINGRIHVSEDSDQAYFLMQLPKKNWDKHDDSEITLTTQQNLEKTDAKLSQQIKEIMAFGSNDIKEIVPKAEDIGFSLLKVKDINFKCSCSLERMKNGVFSLVQSTSLDNVFESNNSIETRCDYCKTYYQILKTDIQRLKN